MESLNRLSVNRPGLSAHRLDGRVDLAHDSVGHRDLFERASVVKVGEGAQVTKPEEPKHHPLAELWERCTQTLSRWARKIFG